jgi:hypothetical protein
MLDPFERGKVWFIYNKLEKEFIETTSYVALEIAHKEVWSEKYGELLIKIGGAVGSFFDLMIESKSLDPEQKIKDLRAKIQAERQKSMAKQKKSKKKLEWNPTMGDYRRAFSQVFQLSAIEVEASYGLTNYGKLKPFEGFRTRPPIWWDSYNKVKHQFFEQIEQKATLQNALGALASLFVLNILHKESQEYLVKYQNVIVCDYLKSMGKENILNFFKASKTGVPKSVSGYNFKAVTPLFTHVFRVDKQADAVAKYICSP